MNQRLWNWWRENTAGPCARTIPSLAYVGGEYRWLTCGVKAEVCFLF